MLVLEYGGSDRALVIQMPAALSHPDELEHLQLGLSDRARAASRRPAPRSARAARCSAARPRSTASSMCAAIRSTSSAGRRRARRAGATPTSCPISAAPRAFAAAATPGAGDDGPLATARGPKHNPLYDAFIEAGRQAGYRGQRRPQRRAAGGLRRLRHDGEGRRALVDRQRLSAAGDEAPEPRRSSPMRSRPGSPSRAAAPSASTTAAAARDVLRAARREVILCGGAINSPQLLKLSGVGPAAELRRASASTSSPTGRASARTCRTISSSISRSPRSSRSRSTATPASSARGLVGLQWLARGRGPRRVQPFRGRRLHPLARRRALSRHPVPFPADGGRLRRLVARQRARLSGACRADALEEPRLGAARLRRSAPSRRRSGSTT